MLSNNHIKNYCQGDANTGRDTCRYLSHRMSTSGYVPVCTKMCKENKKVISSWATGDNCSGYPLLMYIPQGYDVSDK